MNQEHLADSTSVTLNEGTLISIITPTSNREHFLPLVYHCIKSQDWPSIEWLIDDSSPTPSLFINSLSDKRISYWHDVTPRSLGERRNFLASRAKGEYIAHFDDDDFYAPQYIKHLMSVANQEAAVFAKLSAFFVLDVKSSTYAYCDLQRKLGAHLTWSKGSLRLHNLTESDNLDLENTHLGYGFSYFYKRTVWERERFADVSWNEDGDFAMRLSSSHACFLFPDTVGLCLHLLHEGNSSRCFPQFLIPQFIIAKLIPSFKQYLELLVDGSLPTYDAITGAAIMTNCGK